MGYNQEVTCFYSRCASAAFSLSLVACSGSTQKTNTATVLPTQAISVAEQKPEPTPTPPKTKTIELEPLRVVVVRDNEGESEVIATDARSIFDDGNAALADGDWAEALGRYEELLLDFPDSSLVNPALFNAGLALEGLEQMDEAIKRYEILAERDGQGRDGIDARIRSAALYADSQRWNAALEVIDKLLALRRLGSSDRVEGLARRGYVLLEAKDFSAAEVSLREAIAVYDKASAAGELLDGDYFRAMSYFYLGDIPRRQFDALPIRLPEAQMQRDVEAKATLVLLAKERFDDTIGLGNIYWATAAGFRLADMQHSFWRSIVSAPIPPHLNAQASKIYVEQVHLHSLSLLKEALRVHGKNVQVATVYKSQTPWSEASARAVAALTQLVGRSQAGELLGADEGSVELRSPSGEYIPARAEL